jgi:hypothetical protein
MIHSEGWSYLLLLSWSYSGTEANRPPREKQLPARLADPAGTPPQFTRPKPEAKAVFSSERDLVRPEECEGVMEVPEISGIAVGRDFRSKAIQEHSHYTR